MHWQDSELTLMVPMDVDSVPITLRLLNDSDQDLRGIQIKASHADLKVPDQLVVVPAKSNLEIQCHLSAAALQQSVRRQVQAIDPSTEEIIRCRILLRVASPVRIEPSRLVWNMDVPHKEKAIRIAAVDGETDSWHIDTDQVDGFDLRQERSAEGVLALKVTPRVTVQPGLNRLWLLTDRSESRFQRLPIEMLVLPGETTTEKH